MELDKLAEIFKNIESLENVGSADKAIELVKRIEDEINHLDYHLNDSKDIC